MKTAHVFRNSLKKGNKMVYKKLDEINDLKHNYLPALKGEFFDEFNYMKSFQENEIFEKIDNFLDSLQYLTEKLQRYKRYEEIMKDLESENNP